MSEEMPFAGIRKRRFIRSRICASYPLHRSGPRWLGLLVRGRLFLQSGFPALPCGNGGCKIGKCGRKLPGDGSYPAVADQSAQRSHALPVNDKERPKPPLIRPLSRAPRFFWCTVGRLTPDLKNRTSNRPMVSFFSGEMREAKRRERSRRLRARGERDIGRT